MHPVGCTSMQIAVIGAADCTPEEYAAAQEVGRLVATNHGTIICGGMGGVMEAVCKGAKEQGGTTAGILPDMGDGNAYLDIRIRTGMGYSRNVVLVQSADAVIAVGGKYGTLSEIAIALKLKKPVFGCNTWDIDEVVKCSTPSDAVVRAIRAGHPSP